VYKCSDTTFCCNDPNCCSTTDTGKILQFGSAVPVTTLGVGSSSAGLAAATSSRGKSKTVSADSTHTSAPVASSPAPATSNAGRNVGIGVGIGIPIALIAAGLLFFLWRRRRRAGSKTRADPVVMGQGKGEVSHPVYDPGQIPEKDGEGFLPELEAGERGGQKTALHELPAP
jgi:hypothetical protein